MKKLSILAVLAFGMMFTACKKDNETTPVATGGTVTIDFNANVSVNILQDDKTIFNKEYTSNFMPIDSTITLKNVADNSRIDISTYFYKNYTGTLKILYNDSVILDTLLLEPNKPGLFSVTYWANKQIWIQK